VLPYFAYESRKKDLLQISTSFGFCDNIDYAMNSLLFRRIEELDTSIKNELKNETGVRRELDILSNVTKSMAEIVTQIQSVQENWESISRNITMFDEGTDSVNVSNIFRSNVILMNESMVSLYQLAIASDEYVHSKNFYENGTINNFKLLTNYFQRIMTLTNNIHDFEQYLEDLIVGKELFDKPGLNDHDLVMVNIKISKEIVPIDNLVYNIQQDFEQSFTRINIQVTQERETYNAQLKLSQDKIAEDNKVKGYIQKQIEIDTIYA